MVIFDFLTSSQCNCDSKYCVNDDAVAAIQRAQLHLLTICICVNE